MFNGECLTRRLTEVQKSRQDRCRSLHQGRRVGRVSNHQGPLHIRKGQSHVPGRAQRNAAIVGGEQRLAESSKGEGGEHRIIAACHLLLVYRGGRARASRYRADCWVARQGYKPRGGSLPLSFIISSAGCHPATGTHIRAPASGGSGQHGTPPAAWQGLHQRAPASGSWAGPGRRAATAI